MPDDTPTTERSITASIAVFLFAIARHWREVRTSGGTRIPNHLFASSRGLCCKHGARPRGVTQLGD